MSSYWCCSGSKFCCLIPVPVCRKRGCLYSGHLRIHYSCSGQCQSCRIRKGINHFGSWICFWIPDDGESPETEQSCDKQLLEHAPVAGLLLQHDWQKYQEGHNCNHRDDTASPLCFWSFNCIPSGMITILSRFLCTVYERSNYWQGGLYTFFGKEILNALGQADRLASKLLSESAIMKGIIMQIVVCPHLLHMFVN